jgi:F-type H+-transporting ATPase subunit a
MPGLPVPMKLFLAPIEFLGIFIKPISLMIRLFANISAGHIIILSLISLIFIFKSILLAPVSLFFSVFISLIEVLVVAIQAYIFTILSAMYIGSAIEEHEH